MTRRRPTLRAGRAPLFMALRTSNSLNDVSAAASRTLMLSGVEFISATVAQRWRNASVSAKFLRALAYQRAPAPPLLDVSTTGMRNDGAMTDESPWARLHRIANARRQRLGLTLAGMESAGGPTGAWLRSLRTTTGAPSLKSAHALAALDEALRWRPGTSWGLVAEDRSGWADALLTDEEAQLVEEDDEAGHMGTIVAARLRLMAPDDAARAMAEIMRTLGLSDM